MACFTYLPGRKRCVAFDLIRRVWCEVSHLNFELSNLRKIEIKSQMSQIALEYRATGIVEANQFFIIDSVMFEDRTWGCIAFEEWENNYKANWGRIERNSVAVV